MRCLLISVAVMAFALHAQPASANGLGDPIEVDGESGAEVYVLGGDERPADNIYGEQPYGDATGRRIAIRYYPLPNKPGGINLGGHAPAAPSMTASNGVTRTRT